MEKVSFCFLRFFEQFVANMFVRSYYQFVNVYGNSLNSIEFDHVYKK
jgi:hypothetical protein